MTIEAGVLAVPAHAAKNNFCCKDIFLWTIADLTFWKMSNSGMIDKSVASYSHITIKKQLKIEQVTKNSKI